MGSAEPGPPKGGLSLFRAVLSLSHHHRLQECNGNVNGHVFCPLTSPRLSCARSRLARCSAPPGFARLDPALICSTLLCSARAGWEMQTTDQGVVYYVDHINKRTSWDPPLMSTGGMSVIASQLPDIREHFLFLLSVWPTEVPRFPCTLFRWSLWLVLLEQR